jgi:N-methylhydantoinase B
MSISQGTRAFEPGASRIDPIALAVMANRFDAIVREMTHVMVRSARSGIINTARDLSCSIISADDQLVASAEGIPMQVAGGQFQSRALRRLHPDLREGDAFLHNDPYDGGLHAADHTILVPVFAEEEHVFTVAAIAHQGDCGNSVPTTYMVTADDLYEEGALIFPCVRVQRDHQPVEDVIRMCKARIRAPEQWYGDHLAQLGAARIAELRLKELMAKHSAASVLACARAWLDYSERRMIEAVRGLPAGRVEGRASYGPSPNLGGNIGLRVIVSIDPESAMIEVDLRDNPDCVPAGINLTESTSFAAAVMGVLNSLAEAMPANAGSFRRIRVLVRENCVVGIPRHPASCSAGTTDVTHKLINCLQRTFAGVAQGYGLAEGASGHPASGAVVSGADHRFGGRPFVNEMSVAPAGGGPGGPSQDGWPTYSTPVTAGVMYPAGVEVTELKHPLRVQEVRLLPDSGGAGRRRGAPGSRAAFTPTGLGFRAMFTLEDPARPSEGVLGGHPGGPMRAMVVRRDGTIEVLAPGPQDIMVAAGEVMTSETCGGGGYGPPELREPERVLADVEERWVGRDEAERVYRVALTELDPDALAVDSDATAQLRKAEAA